ncbi:MAG: hypothetical protein LBM17_09460 [Candidatus Accumulibacter sp.]|jgi:hypothetical protein|nr:hypothetical protein [Accumulibacter sp.]
MKNQGFCHKDSQRQIDALRKRVDHFENRLRVHGAKLGELDGRTTLAENTIRALCKARYWEIARDVLAIVLALLALSLGLPGH